MDTPDNNVYIKQGVKEHEYNVHKHVYNLNMI